MAIEVLETVVLKRDLPEFGLQEGDVGAVVELYDGGGIEVEFVMGSGHTQALVTLVADDVRPFGPDDLLTARTVNAA